MADNAKESWSQSEELIRTLVSSHIGVQIAEDRIKRAHRLGTFVRDKSRPIIVKFSSFKLKDTIFAQKGKLKSTGITISEDFCRATRNTRKNASRLWESEWATVLFTL